MIILDDTSTTLEISLGGAVTTNELQYVVSHVDVATDTYALTNMSVETGVTTGATPVTMVAAPSAVNQRKIDTLTVYQNDTVVQTVTINVNDNSSLRTVVEIILQAGETLQYDGQWTVIDSTGGIKPAGANMPPSGTDNSVQRRDGATGRELQDSGVIIDDSDNITGVTTLDIDVTTGTAPITVASTTLVTNLNADLLDGNHASAFQPIDPELSALAGLVSAADQLPYFTGSGTAALTTLTAAARTILDDASTEAIRTTLGVGTADSPQFTAINLGHATDTTLARSSAGNMTIEGNIVYRAGGTDVPVTDGGTGRSTSTTAYGLIAAGTTATGAHQTLAAGATTQILVGGGAAALPVWTTATGSGAPVRATSPTLVTPTLGIATATALLAASNDSGAIGASGTAFSDLFLASGAVINFNAGDVTLTHAANDLAIQGGEVIIGGTTPAKIFHVNSTAATGASAVYIERDGSAGNTNTGVRFQQLQGFAQFGVAGTSGDLRVTFDSEDLSAATTFSISRATGNVGIGTSSPDGTLHVHTATAGSVTALTNSVATLENNADSGLQFLIPDANDAFIAVGSPTRTNDHIQVTFDLDGGTAPNIKLLNDTAERFRFTLDSTPALGIGGDPGSTTYLLTPAATTSASSVRLPHGSAPTSPVDGDIWTTTAGLFVRINGSTVGPLT